MRRDKLVLTIYVLENDKGERIEVVDEHVSLAMAFGAKVLYRIKYYIKG